MNKKTTIAVTVAVILVGILIGGGLINGLLTNNKAQDTTMQQQNPKIQDATELGSKDVIVGTGAEAIAGLLVQKQLSGKQWANFIGFVAAQMQRTPACFDRIEAAQARRGKL